MLLIEWEALGSKVQWRPLQGNGAFLAQDVKVPDTQGIALKYFLQYDQNGQLLYNDFCTAMHDIADKNMSNTDLSNETR